MTTKLLAVDDSKTMRRVLEITFSGEEFQTTILSSAADALTAIQESPPHVALVDAHLGNGEGNGYDLCRSIKATAPGTRVIILSSKQRPYDEGLGSAAGADGSFDKPFDSTKIIARINEAAATAASSQTAPLSPEPAPAPAVAPPLPPEPEAPAAPVPSASTAARSPAPVGIAPFASAKPVQASPAPRPHVAAAPSSGVAPALASGVASESDAIRDLEAKLGDLGLTNEQLVAVLSLSREVVEKVVWEVVPVLAETLIKEEIARLTAQ